MTQETSDVTRPFQPYAVRSEWLPGRQSLAWAKFHQTLADQVETLVVDDFCPEVTALYAFLSEHPVVASMFARACAQNKAMLETPDLDTDEVPIPAMPDAFAFAARCQALQTVAPHFVDDDLVGLPFSAMTVAIDPTLAGSQLLGLPEFNAVMKPVLDRWHNTFLKKSASDTVFTQDGKDWLSDAAKKSYKFDDWEVDNHGTPSPSNPVWTSWNSFFTRNFKDPASQRPVAEPDTNRVVISPNDGSLFRWDNLTSSHDTFWFKDMNYSLADILSSDDPDQQRLIDEHDLVNTFVGGYIFQTYLNPYNFHRWWVPVNGRILFDPFSIPGAYFNKLVLPDFGGGTTASLPYLAEVNARGLIVFETDDFGKVACLPLGMSEVSTIAFCSDMKAHATVSKGHEMGRFNYGGSSFVTLYEKSITHRLQFELPGPDGQLQEPPKRPSTASSSSGSGAWPTQVGGKIGEWITLPA